MWVRLRLRRAVIVLGVVIVLMLATWRSWARPLGLVEPAKPRPDVVNMRYGPHDRNVLDLWKAKPRSGLDATAPVVIIFHGGAFRTGDKSHVPATLLENDDLIQAVLGNDRGGHGGVGSSGGSVILGPRDGPSTAPRPPGGYPRRWVACGAASRRAVSAGHEHSSRNRWNV